jgi:hypothetical protein
MSDNKETKQAPAVEAKSYDPFNPIDGVISNKAPAVEAAREATCATCKGLGVVDEGEITGSGGVEFENGPIKCFKDCPQCVGKRHVVEAGARDEREDFEAAMEKHGRMRPFTRWPSDDSYTDDRIEWARRGWLAALARASESAEVPAGYKLVPAEPTVEMLNAALPHDVTFGHGFKRRIYQEMIAAAPQPASEQQPIPQVFTDTGDAVRGTFGKTVFAEMSNSDDLWSVWLDGWLRASEQHAASGLSDDVRSRLEFYAACYCKSTSATDREAGKAMYALLAAKGDGQ